MFSLHLLSYVCFYYIFHPIYIFITVLKLSMLQFTLLLLLFYALLRFLFTDHSRQHTRYVLSLYASFSFSIFSLFISLIFLFLFHLSGPPSLPPYLHSLSTSLCLSATCCLIELFCVNIFYSFGIPFCRGKNVLCL